MNTQRVLLVTAASQLSFFVAIEFAAGSDGLRTVALSGNLAPDTEVGVEFEAFSFFPASPILNNKGQVAFAGLLAGASDSSKDTGIWKEGENGITLVAQEGAVAPGTNVSFSDLRGVRFVMNNQSSVAFRGGLDTSQPGVNSTNYVGVWSETQGDGLALIARGGDLAPGANVPFRADTFSNLALNSNDQVALNNLLQGPGVNSSNSSGIWGPGSGNGLALITREGNEVAGTAPGMTFGNIGSLNTGSRLNDNGQTVFHASLRPPGAVNDLANEESVWRGGSSGLDLIARQGDVAPGVDLAARFRFFSQNEGLAINAQGHTAFRASLELSTPGIDNNNNGGIWSEGGGNGLSLIAREGDHAPGVPEGVLFNFSTIPDDLVLNNNGHVAFLGFLQGDEFGSGIWSEGKGKGLELVARSGSPAPGTESGVNFLNFFSTSMVLNNSGQTAFYASLSGPGIVDSSNDGGIWAEDLAGKLRLVARKGEQIDVSDDPQNPDLRTISFLVPIPGNSGNGDGRPSAFNDLGQLVFAARFTDGAEGVFVSNLVATPEPSAVLLFVALVLVYLPSRRWRLLSFA